MASTSFLDQFARQGQTPLDLHPHRVRGRGESLGELPVIQPLDKVERQIHDAGRLGGSQQCQSSFESLAILVEDRLLHYRRFDRASNLLDVEGDHGPVAWSAQIISQPRWQDRAMAQEAKLTAASPTLEDAIEAKVTAEAVMS